MSSSSLSFRYFTYRFLSRHGFPPEDLGSARMCADAMRRYFAGFSVVYEGDDPDGLVAFWWDREDGWLPVSLLPNPSLTRLNKAQVDFGGAKSFERRPSQKWLDLRYKWL